MSAPDLDRLLDHSQWLRPMARALVHDEHLAEDVLQETYLAAVRRPPTEAPLGAWLAHVLRNVVRMHARKEGRRSIREERVARPERGEGPSQNDLLELDLLKEIVRKVAAAGVPVVRGLLLQLDRHVVERDLRSTFGVKRDVHIALIMGVTTMISEIAIRSETKFAITRNTTENVARNTAR